jgi:glucoamylase
MPTRVTESIYRQEASAQVRRRVEHRCQLSGCFYAQQMLLLRGRRLQLRQLVAAACSAVIVAAMIPLGVRFEHQSNVALSSASVAVGKDGSTVEVDDIQSVVPGYRVLRGTASTTRWVQEQQAWLNAGTLPQVPGVAADLSGNALLDLHVLTHDYGVTVAARSARWRYVWPRDTAFVASAFARTGHLEDATRNLDFLQKVQPASGLYHARYLPDGSGVPDSRGVQLDGTGWALWGVAEVVRQQTTPAARFRISQRYQQLLDRSANATTNMISKTSQLPPPSADYWEVKPAGVSLATCSVLLTGLLSAAYLYDQLHDATRGDIYREAARQLQGAVLEQFGATGYSRYLDGSPRSVDLGVTFLLPPFANIVDLPVVDVWRRAQRQMQRPAGGLAPGGAWRRDGISWTPTTATVAAAAACTDPAQALRWLDWIAAHRTNANSIPEKVLADGQPASVAPLAWSAAAVVIAIDELQTACPDH